MSKVILHAPYLRKAVTSVGSPSPETTQFASLNQNPRSYVKIRKLKSEEIAKVAAILDFSDDYEAYNS